MQGRQWRGWGAEGAIALRDFSRIEGAAGHQRRPALILVQYPPSFYWRPWQTVDNSRKTQEDRISLQSSKTHASFLPFFAMCLWYKVILSGANARWKKKKPSSEDSLLWWCSHKKSLQFFSFTFPGETNVPYARHYKLWLAYLLHHFWSPFPWFLGGVFRKKNPYVWLVLKSRLWRNM